MTTEEHRLLLYYEQNIHKDVLEYFNPLLFLKEIPVFLSNDLIDHVVEWYKEKTRRLGLIDIYFLFKLSKEAVLQNILLNKLLGTEELSKKLKLFFNVFDTNDFESISGAAYFEKFPNGRTPQSVW